MIAYLGYICICGQKSIPIICSNIHATDNLTYVTGTCIYLDTHKYFQIFAQILV